MTWMAVRQHVAQISGVDVCETFDLLDLRWKLAKAEEEMNSSYIKRVFCLALLAPTASRQPWTGDGLQGSRCTIS